MEYYVALTRGKGKEPRIWKHPNERSAMRRADALASLHSATICYDRDKHLYTVNADEFYTD